MKCNQIKSLFINREILGICVVKTKLNSYTLCVSLLRFQCHESTQLQVTSKQDKKTQIQQNQHLFEFLTGINI